jgi:hypothetical protein
MSNDDDRVQAQEHTSDEDELFFDVRIIDLPSEGADHPLILLLILSIILSRDTIPGVTLLSSDGSQQMLRNVQTAKTYTKEIALGWTYGYNGQTTWQAAPIPSDCSPSSDIGSMHTIGHFPVWIFGFDGPKATIHLPRITMSNSTWQGWSIPLQVGIKFDFVGYVALSAGNVHDGPTPQLSDDQTDPSSILVLNPQQLSHAGNYNAHKRTFIHTITLHIPGAGCYFMTAGWPNGHWLFIFTAGQ